MQSIGENVNWLIDNGYTQDLLNILIGENEFSNIESFEELDNHSSILRSVTICYLELLLTKGAESEEDNIIDNNLNLLSEYFAYFEAWKLALCPGISPAMLDSLVDFKKQLK